MKNIPFIRTIFLYASLAAVLLLCFCGTYRHDLSMQQYSDLATQKQFSAVGAVSVAGKHKGSCVLVGDRYVLSAAHVFLRDRGAGEGYVSSCTVELNGKQYTSSRVVVHNGYKRVSKFAAYDIALVELTEPVQDVAPATLSTEFNEMGDTVYIAGYGPSRPADMLDGRYDEGFRRLAGSNVLDSMNGVIVNGHPDHIGFDFDSPDGSSNNACGDSVPTAFEYLPTGGDSGGGAFIKRHGQWLLVGLTSHGKYVAGIKSGWYGSVCFLTRLACYGNWIQEAIAGN